MLTALVMLGDRFLRRDKPDRVRPGQILLLSYIGVLLHVFMDLMNSYGVRLLMPFSERWFYGDALYIVDPILLVTVGFGWWLAGWRQKRARPNPFQPARIGLIVAGAYVLAMIGSNLIARYEVRSGLTRAGRSADTKFMVTPVFANPFRREVVVDVGDRYEKGHLWFDPLPHFRPAGYGVEKGFGDPAAEAALQLPRAQAFLRWSRFPFVQVNVSPPLDGVWINDYRYASAGPYGWSAQKLR